MTSCAVAWAEEEFGGAELGNQLRTRRLVLMAAQAADRPAGQVTKVFATEAERHAAFRFLASGEIEAADVCATAARAALARIPATSAHVFVPVDGSSLTLSDRDGKRGMGSIGTYRSKRQGLKVMNAIGVDVDGTPLGLLAQDWWTRPRTRMTQKPHSQRTLAEKETRHWLEVIETVEERFAETDCHAVPWFQLDAEGDFREMIKAMDGRSSFITVRAAHNRRVADPELRDLWTSLDAQPLLGCYGLTVRPGPTRKGREAHIEVRACEVELRLRDPRKNSRGPYEWATLSAVLVLEVGTTPKDEKPIRWLLLTNHPVTSFHDACEVIFGYSQRWRVEDFHRTWKSHCHVQDSQLRTPSRVQLWATILAAIAMRAERLKHLARNEPLQPASVEFSPEEIDAIIVLRRPPNVRRGSTPSIADAVRWVADLGGYTGKSSGGPPGSIVIGRGLAKVEIAVLTLRNIASEPNA